MREHATPRSSCYFLSSTYYLFASHLHLRLHWVQAQVLRLACACTAPEQG
jgi:hypothetical protein